MECGCHTICIHFEGEVEVYKKGGRWPIGIEKLMTIVMVYIYKLKREQLIFLVWLTKLCSS